MGLFDFLRKKDKEVEHQITIQGRSKQNYEAKRGRFMMGLKNGAKAEIAKTWHNLDDVKSPKDWLVPVKDICKHMMTRKVSGPPERTSIEGNKWARTTINWMGDSFQIGCCLDLYDTGAQLRHVYIKIPRNKFQLRGKDIKYSVADVDRDINDMLEQVALAFEQHEPAFHSFFFCNSDVIAHLIWPSDWNEFHSVLAFSDIMPLYSPPIWIEKTDQPDGWHYDICYQDTWQSQVTTSELDEWYSTLVDNLVMIRLVVIYLDLQTSQDLFFWQFSNVNSLVLICGETFVRFVKYLIHDRLGECQCGHIAARKLSPGDKLKENEVSLIVGKLKNEKCRQLKEILIWPLSHDWWLGRFKYICPQCGVVIRYGRCTRILEPSPVQPDLGPFMRSYSAFMDLIKEK